MLSFLLRRLLYGVTVLFGVVTLVFFLFTLVPDPARELAGQSESEDVIAAIRRKFSLDLPATDRYLLFLNDVSPISRHSLDEASRTWRADNELTAVTLHSGENYRWVVKWPYLGRSWITGKGVGALLSESMPATFLLALVAMAFALVIGSALGLVSALRKDSALDRFILVTASVGMSGPSFFTAILIAWLFGYVWFAEVPVSLWFVLPIVLLPSLARMVGKRGVQWWIAGVCSGVFFWSLSRMVDGWPVVSFALPGTGLPMSGSLYEVDVWKGEQLALQHLLLPALTLGIRPLAVIAQLMRNSALEVMSHDYVRTARAKGLSETAVITRHVVRNALNPVITAASGWLASMLAGAVFVEFVFGWKGLGMEMFRSLEKNDLPVVMGAVMVVATVFVVVNTLVDIVYGWIDPRVRMG